MVNKETRSKIICASFMLGLVVAGGILVKVRLNEDRTREIQSLQNSAKHYLTDKYDWMYFNITVDDNKDITVVDGNGIEFNVSKNASDGTWNDDYMEILYGDYCTQRVIETINQNKTKFISVKGFNDKVIQDYNGILKDADVAFTSEEEAMEYVKENVTLEFTFDEATEETEAKFAKKFERDLNMLVKETGFQNIVINCLSNKKKIECGI